jgi:hypothetical protein
LKKDQINIKIKNNSIIPHNYYFKLSKSYEEFHKLFKKYIYGVLPKEFEQTPFIERFWEYIWDHHLFLKIFKTIFNFLIGDKSNTIKLMYKNNYNINKIKKYRNNEKIEQIYDIIHAITILTVSCFILALLYDFQYPSDDASCSNYADIDSCLNKKLIFDSTQTYCQWIPIYSPGYLNIIKDNNIIETISIENLILDENNIDKCIYNENNTSIKTTIITMIITIFTSIVLDIFLSKLINYLRAYSNINYNLLKTKNTNKIININDNMYTNVVCDYNNSIKNNMELSTNLKKTLHPNKKKTLYIKKTYKVFEELNIIKNKLSELYNKINNIKKNNTQSNDLLNFMNLEQQNILSDKIITNIFKIFSDIDENNYDIGLAHVIYSDLIGQESYSEKIFSMFIKKTFITETYVNYKIKLLSIILLIGINLGSLFYVALKGAIRGRKWQYIYLNACVINWVSEIFFVQFIEILWIHFIVANTIRNKVLIISEFLNSLAFTLYSNENLNIYSLNKKYINWLSNKKMYSKFLLSIKTSVIESKLINNIFNLKNNYLESNLENNSNNNSEINSENNLFLNDSKLTIFLSMIPFELHRILSSLFSSILIVLLIIIWYNVNFIVMVLITLIFSGLLLSVGYLKNKKLIRRSSFNFYKENLILSKIFIKNKIMELESLNGCDDF